MKYLTLHYTCVLDASIQEVFAFHTDTHNLPAITPPSIGVKIVKRENDTVILDIRKFGITTRWEMRIEMNAPHSIVDVMLKGPFACFRHERVFIEEEKNRTRMEETITLASPIPLLHNLFFWFVKRDMDAMFAYRHHMTHAHFRFENETKKLS